MKNNKCCINMSCPIEQFPEDGIILIDEERFKIIHKPNPHIKITSFTIRKLRWHERIINFVGRILGRIHDIRWKI